MAHPPCPHTFITSLLETSVNFFNLRFTVYISAGNATWKGVRVQTMESTPMTVPSLPLFRLFYGCIDFHHIP
jgi:hypothetical protein